MDKALKKIFDDCDWSDKHADALPESMDNVRYLWREEEAPFASLFFTSGILKEETSAVKRSLYFGKDKQGAWALCVVERTQADFNPGEVAKQFYSMIDVSSLHNVLRRSGVKVEQDEVESS